MYVYVTYYYMTLIVVHEMRGRVHPNQCHITSLFANQTPFHHQDYPIDDHLYSSRSQ